MPQDRERTQTLASAVRRKYPDAYLNIPDSELEVLVLKKYPGKYDHVPLTVPPGQNVEEFEQYQKNRARGFRPRRTVGGTLKDMLVTAGSQTVGALYGTPVALADIATSIAGRGTPVGDFVARTPTPGYSQGASIQERQRLFESFYSPAEQYASREVGEAEGVRETLEAVKRNPSVIPHTVVGALPHMLTGAGIARGAVTTVGKVAPKAAAWFRPVAPALGEGVVSGAQTAAQIKDQMGELTPGQAGLAAGSGLLTGVFTRIGGRIARNMGVADIDSVLAGVQTDSGLRRHVVNRILIGMVQEGVLEELPQSMQEQVAQNLATGQPLSTGVSQAGVLGLFTGLILGGGTQMMMRRPTQPITPPAQLPAPLEVRKDAQQPVIEISETETAAPPPDVTLETGPEVTTPAPEGVPAPPVTPVKPEVPVGEPVTLAAPPDAPTVPVPPIVTEPGTEPTPTPTEPSPVKLKVNDIVTIMMPTLQWKRQEGGGMSRHVVQHKKTGYVWHIRDDGLVEVRLQGEGGIVTKPENEFTFTGKTRSQFGKSMETEAPPVTKPTPTVPVPPIVTEPMPTEPAFRRGIDPYPVQTEPFKRETKPTPRLEAPGVREELERMADEMGEFQYERSILIGGQFDDPDVSAAGATEVQRISMGRNADVWRNILSESPYNRSSKKGKKLASESEASQGTVVEALETLRETGIIHNNLAEGALRVAEMRVANNYATISRPQLSGSVRQMEEETAVNRLTTAKTSQEVAYATHATWRKAEERLVEIEQDTKADLDFEAVGIARQAAKKAKGYFEYANRMRQQDISNLSEEQRSQVEALPPPSEGDPTMGEKISRSQREKDSIDFETAKEARRVANVSSGRLASAEKRRADKNINIARYAESQISQFDAEHQQDLVAYEAAVANITPEQRAQLEGETGVQTAGEAAAQQPPLLPEDAAAKGQFRKPAPRGLDAPLVTRPAMTVETILPAEFPELLVLAKELLGDTPSVMKKIRGKGVKGVFRGRLDNPTIELLTDLFEKGNEFQLEATLAHEIGHLVDWLPQKTLARGNLLGRLQSLRKFMRREFSVHKPMTQPGSRGEEGFMLEPAGRVIQNKDILAELKAFSLKWRPWNPEKASAKTRAYRNQARELYADALSGLLIAPQELQAEAPLFFQTFFDLLDAKPQVKKQYWALQEWLRKPEVDRLAARAERHEAGFVKGETKRQELFEKDLERKSFARSPFQLWRRGKSEVIELQTPLTDFYREHNIPAEEWLDHLNNEIQYLGGKRKAFTDEYMLPIVHAIEPTVGMEAFGRALIYKRITDGDRQNIANPYGINPENAAKQYAHLKDQLGPANTKILETQLARFQEMVQSVTEQAYKGGLLSKKLYESMKKNPAYATFSVVDHIERDISPQIYGQKGTLREIENPAFATYQKLMKTLAWIARSDSNRQIATQLAKIDPEAMEKATVDQTTTNKFGVVRSFMPAPPGKGLIRFMEDGVAQGYYAEEYLAKAVNYQSPEFNSSILDVITLANTQLFKPLFTMVNIGFMGSNSVRDWFRFWRNNPTMTVRRSLRRYIQALPMAKIRAFGVPKNPTRQQLEAAMGLHEARKAGMIAESWNQHIEGQRKGDRDIDALMREVKTPELQEPAPHALLKPFAALYDTIFKVGTFVETLAKAGQLYELTAKKTAAGVPFPQAVSEITPQERQHLRRDVGSPDFLGIAGWKEVTNNIWIYSYASTQGKRSDLRMALDGSYPKTMGITSWWWKTIGATVVPKAFIAAAMYGMFGDEIRRVYERMTEYDRKHYTPIPLSWSPFTGPVTYFRMPTGDSDRVIGSLVYSLLMSGKEGHSLTKTLMSILRTGTDQFPSVTPSVGILPPLAKMVTGENPRDPFRDRDILTQREQEARGWPAWKKFFGWGFQFLGGSTFYKFYPGERLPERRTPTQRFLELPFVSSHLGRFIRSTDYGDTERLRKVRGPERKATARGLTEEDRLIYEVVESIQRGRRVNDRRLKRMARSIAARAWPDDPRRGRERYESGTVEDRLKRAISRGTGGRWEQENLGARSKRERAIIRRDFRESMGR